MRPTSSFVHGALKFFHVYLIIYSFNLTGIIHYYTLSHPLIIAVACSSHKGYDVIFLTNVSIHKLMISDII